MKTLYNFLVPKFLRDFDDYLLRNYPVVWRTKAIFVLFYGVLAIPILFMIGFYIPINAQFLTVDPIQSIRPSSDPYYLLTFVLCGGIFILLWAYSQYQMNLFFTKFKETLVTLCLYALCFAILLGFTIPALRIGTIVRTAHYWMPEKDLQFFEDNAIYPYGFMLLNTDTIYIPPSDTFFQNREILFRSACKIEDTILQNRYNRDIAFQRYWIVKHSPNLRPYLDMNPFDNQTLHGLSESNWSNPYEVWHRNYRSQNWSFVNYSIDYLGIRYLSSYGQQKHFIFLKQYSNYNFLNDIDSTKAATGRSEYDSVMVYRPTLPYSIENAVRSVKHARQYLNEGVYFYYLKLLFSCLFLFASLFYLVPLLTLKNLVIAFILNYGILAIEGTNDVYLGVLMISLFWLLEIAFKKQKIEHISVLFNTIFIAILFNSQLALTFQEKFSVGAFLIVQVLALGCVFLTTYVRTLPKG